MQAKVSEIQEADIRRVEPVAHTSMADVFSDINSFELGQRMAQALAKSTIVPKDYQGNIGNTLIALEMASRLNTSPLLVMQHLYVVNGRPAWSSQYIIAMINNSGRYKTELQFEITGKGDSMECYAWVMDYNDHKVTGPTITMAMAKAEGWVQKNGSKWKTMPEVMIRYRAASFFGRLNCPDLIMGLYSVDEAKEIIDTDYEIVQNEVAANGNTVPVSLEEPAPQVEDTNVHKADTPDSSEQQKAAPEAEPETDKDGQVLMDKPDWL